MYYGGAKLYHSVFGQCFVNIAFKICWNALFFWVQCLRISSSSMLFGFLFYYHVSPQFSERRYAVRRLQINVSDI